MAGMGCRSCRGAVALFGVIEYRFVVARRFPDERTEPAAIRGVVDDVVQLPLVVRIFGCDQAILRIVLGQFVEGVFPVGGRAVSLQERPMMSNCTSCAMSLSSHARTTLTLRPLA